MCLDPIVHFSQELFDILEITDKRIKNYVPYSTIKKRCWELINQLHLENKVDFYNCRKCLGCLAVKKLDWVKRCEIEKRNWNNVYFITLTFNDSNYHHANKKRFLSRWINRKFNSLIGKGNFKYFAVSEYGEKTNRFHYHLILFTNYLFDDLEQFKKSKRNNVLYLSNWFTDNWKYGFHQINLVDSIASFKYCCKYTAKNQNLKIYVSRGLGDRLPAVINNLNEIPKSLLINAYARVWNANRRYKKHEISKDVLFNVIKENERYNALKCVKRDYLKKTLFSISTVNPIILNNSYFTKYLHVKNSKREL